MFRVLRSDASIMLVRLAKDTAIPHTASALPKCPLVTCTGSPGDRLKLTRSGTSTSPLPFARYTRKGFSIRGEQALPVQPWRTSPSGVVQAETELRSSLGVAEIYQRRSPFGSNTPCWTEGDLGGPLLFVRVGMKTNKHHRRIVIKLSE